MLGDVPELFAADDFPVTTSPTLLCLLAGPNALPIDELEEDTVGGRFEDEREKARL